MKKSRLILIIFLLVLVPPTQGNDSPQTINLLLDESFIINDAEIWVDQDILLHDNSTLVAKNSQIYLLNQINITFNDYSQLILMNSSISSEIPFSIRIRDNASAVITDSTIGSTLETLSKSGIGVSETGKLNVSNSMVGYIRQTDNAITTLTECNIGDLGTRSHGLLRDTGSRIDKATFSFENNVIEFNRTFIENKLSLSSSEIVKTGVSYPFTFTNTLIESPPNLVLSNCYLESNNSKFGDVYMFDNSIATFQNSNISQIYLEKFGNAYMGNSFVEEVICYNGDFIVEIQETTVNQLLSYLTIGLNLKIEDAEISDLHLMYAHPDAPHNIEIVRTNIEKLQMSPGGPTSYQFFDSFITDKIIFEPDTEGYNYPTLTGGLSFSDNISITHIPGEGETMLGRVYKISVNDQGEPVKNTPVEITANNSTLFSGSTNDEGFIVFKLKFYKVLELIQNQSGGQYLMNKNNFTEVANIQVLDHSVPINITSKTPISLNIMPPEKIDDENETQNITIMYDDNIILLIIGIIIILSILVLNKYFPR